MKRRRARAEIVNTIAKQQGCWLNVIAFHQEKRCIEMSAVESNIRRGCAHPNAHQTGMQRRVIGSVMMNMAHSTDWSPNREREHHDGHCLRNRSFESLSHEPFP